MPQMPVPLINSQVMAIPSMPISMKPMETTMNQLRGVRPPRTTPLILSVIEPNVCPGSISGTGGYIAGFGLIMCRSRGGGRLQLGIRVADSRQVRRPGARVEILEHAVVAFELFHLRDAALRVVEVAEHDRVGRAGGRAGGHDLA